MSDMVQTIDSGATNPEALHCKNHPNTETLLCCNRCNEPICMKCAVQTAVGYRCKECIRGVQDNYFNAENRDYPVAFGVSLIVTAIAAPLLGTLIGSFGFFGFFIAFIFGSAAGGLLAQIIRASVGKRRGRYLRQAMLAGVILGVLLGNTAALLVFGIFPLLTLSMLLFTILAASTAYQLLR